MSVTLLITFLNGFHFNLKFTFLYLHCKLDYSLVVARCIVFFPTPKDCLIVIEFRFQKVNAVIASALLT